MPATRHEIHELGVGPVFAVHRDPYGPMAYGDHRYYSQPGGYTRTVTESYGGYRDGMEGQTADAVTENHNDRDQ